MDFNNFRFKYNKYKESDIHKLKKVCRRVEKLFNTIKQAFPKPAKNTPKK